MSASRLTQLIRSTAPAAAVLILSTTIQAQQPEPVGSRNFDIRLDTSAATVAYAAQFALPAASVADMTRVRTAGLARLRADFPTVDVENSPELGTVEVLGVRPGSGFLTDAGADRAGSMRGFLSIYADAYGLISAEVGSLVVVANYMNPANNMGWVELEQRINGLPVFRGVIRGGFTAAGELARTTGALGSGLTPAQLPQSPSLTAEQAVAAAAMHVGWNVSADVLVQKDSTEGRITFDRGPMADEAKAWLLYFPLAPGVARLAWSTEIWGQTDSFLVIVDAADGTVLFRKNLTEYQSQPATYAVYADDSPAPLSPTNVLPGSGTQPPNISRTMQTLIGNEPPNTFNNLGWMTDNTNGSNGSTAGNNVQAGLDRDLIDGVDASVNGVGRVFNFPYTPGTDEPLAGYPPINDFQKGEVTDAFYWTNVYHDRLYLLGFTEAARNFQTNNFGRGGFGNDRVRAEVEDFDGTNNAKNNANFTTPADGTSGRMQMYIFPGPTPDRTSALDHDVLLHELTHGTSNRLHFNTAGLTTQMSRGMGEGWSDFYARALLSSASENVNGVYAIGAWTTHQMVAGYTDNYYYGIRRFPYAVITSTHNGKPHNPLTFADIDYFQIDVSDGAFAPSPLFGTGPTTALEVHNAGEVWASALFEVRARFITRLGYAVGNQRILQYVTDGMKLDAASPSMVQGRDAIIAAANAGGGTGEDIKDIWAGFAARGMGKSAGVLNRDAGTVLEAFDVPGVALDSYTLVSESIPNGRLDPNEDASVSFCLINPTAAPTGLVVGTLLATGGVTSPPGPISFGSIPASGTQCRTFSFTVTAAFIGYVEPTLRVEEPGNIAQDFHGFFEALTQIITDFDEPEIIVPALPANWSTSTLSGTSNLFTTVFDATESSNVLSAGAPESVSDNVLVSPRFTLPLGQAYLVFSHKYSLQQNGDGVVIEMAIDEEPFQDLFAAGGVALQGGYTGSIVSPTSPLTGRQAWTGNTSGFSFGTSITLPQSAAGHVVRFRWRIATDNFTASTGWSLDYVSIGGGMPPDPAQIEPTYGPSSGGTTVAIYGYHLPASDATVTFGGVPASVISYGPNPITVVVGAHPAGTVDVVMTDAFTQQSTMLQAYTYIDPPTITDVLPRSSPVSGGVNVTIKGTSLSEMTVTIGGVQASLNYRSASTLVVVPPLLSPGCYDVGVSNPAVGSATKTKAFAYLPVFTDGPSVAPLGIIKRVHITELRTAVDQVRNTYSLGGFSYVDPTLTAGVTTIKAAHLADLRTALDEAYVAAGFQPPTYTTSISQGSFVKAADINELRVAVNALPRCVP